MSNPGRPSKRTDAVRKALIAELQKGKPLEVSAAVAGVSERFVQMWAAEDQDFADEVARARLIGCSKLHDLVAKGDPKGIGFGKGRAALEILSRRYPKHYSAKVQVSVQNEIERVLDVAERVLTRADFERLLAGVAAIDSEIEAPETPAGAVTHH